MDINKAREIVAILAEGIDSTTGEVLADDNVCNKPEVLRALYTILKHAESYKNLPENVGKPWSKEDDALLLELYKSGSSIKELICCGTGHSLEYVHKKVQTNYGG